MSQNKLTQDSLERWLWSAADILRGSFSSNQYQMLIFPVMFLKRSNDRFFELAQKESEETGMSIEEVISDPENFEGHIFLPEISRWEYLLNTTEDIGIAMDKALQAIENEEVNGKKLEGVLTVTQFSDNAVDNIVINQLLKHFNKHSLANNNLESFDILGNAYEYLLAKFSEGGGKGGEFYTPKEIVKLMIELIAPIQNVTVYDPTAGSGGLLIESARYIEEHFGKEGSPALYGQEKNRTTWGICKLNMFAHGYNANIKHGDTLVNPKIFEDYSDSEESVNVKQFDRVVANPPYSIDKWWSPIESTETGKVNYNKDVEDPFGRFVHGIAPRGKGDFAFVQHIIASLKEEGKGAVVLPHGILFRGSSEGKIRKGLLEDNLIEAVIGLPEKLFTNTGIPVCIIILNKNKGDDTSVKFLDTSDMYVSGKNQNSLTLEHINTIVSAYNAGKEVDKLMRVISFEEIKENDFNMNIARYIDKSEAEAIIDIAAVKNRISDIETEEAEIDKKLNGFLKELGF